MKFLALTAATLTTVLSSLAIATTAPEGRVEKILGYAPSSKGVIFQVTSGGCTKKEHFQPSIVRSETGVVQLKLMRIRPDLCYPFLPMGERLAFTYEDLGFNAGERFTIMNPNGIVLGWIWEQQD
jgi:hypothetical protein